MNSKSVSIIIPVLKEPYLPELTQKIKSLLPDAEIIIIGSDKEQSFTSQIEGTKFYRSYGDSLERSILLGFSVANGDKLIVMDADGSHPPELLPEIIENLDKSEMVVASRYLPKSKYQNTLFRKLTSLIFVETAKLLGATLTDPMSGYFGIRRELLNGITFKPYKWKVALEIHQKIKPTTIELPFTFTERKSGLRKSNFRVGIKLLYDMLVDSI